MVQTWSTEDADNEKCSSCGAEYRVTVSRLPARESDSFNCLRCGSEMKKWSGTETYSFVAVESGE